MPITTEICLFVERCRAPIVGVTGTKGKSTTSAMLGQILKRRYTTWLGGNIGKSLLDDLPRIQPDHIVVLELSSFMLHYLGERRVVAAHRGVDHARPRPHRVARLVRGLQRGKAEHRQLPKAGGCGGRSEEAAPIVEELPPSPGTPGEGGGARAGVQSSASEMSPAQDPHPSPPPEHREREPENGRRIVTYSLAAPPFAILVPGQHNQLNAQAAFAAASILGVSWDDAQAALLDFNGLPHRLQLIHESAGVRWFNDSIATIPQAAAVALEAFEPRRVIHILGGSDKGLDITPMIDAVAKRAKAWLCIGVTGPAVAKRCEPPGQLTCESAATSPPPSAKRSHSPRPATSSCSAPDSRATTSSPTSKSAGRRSQSWRRSSGMGHVVTPPIP